MCRFLVVFINAERLSNIEKTSQFVFTFPIQGQKNVWNRIKSHTTGIMSAKSDKSAHNNMNFMFIWEKRDCRSVKWLSVQTEWTPKEEPSAMLYKF